MGMHAVLASCSYIAQLATFLLADPANQPARSKLSVVLGLVPHIVIAIFASSVVWLAKPSSSKFNQRVPLFDILPLCTLGSINLCVILMMSFIFRSRSVFMASYTNVISSK